MISCVQVFTFFESLEVSVVYMFLLRTNVISRLEFTDKFLMCRKLPDKPNLGPNKILQLFQ